jgi:hypothetical protein
MMKKPNGRRHDHSCVVREAAAEKKEDRAGHQPWD